ncbi:MAG: radical SAM/SPASM domain-containing protein [Bacteroidota bacterium]
MIFPLLRILTFRKILNYLLVVSSFYLSRLIKRPILWGMPFAISIETTAICQLACPECQTGLGLLKRNQKLIDNDTFNSIINQLSPYLFHVQLNFQGEAFNHPYIIDFIKYAHKKKILTSISTHAQNIDEAVAQQITDSGLTNLIISVDGIDEETYRTYRANGSLQKTLKAVSLLKAYKKKSTPKLIMQFIVFRHNEYQIPLLKSFYKEHGFDTLRIKTAQFNNFEQGNHSMPNNNNYCRYKSDANGRYSIKSNLSNHCFRSWSRCIVTTDGVVIPCCFDKHANYPYANIKSQTFSSVWKGEASLNFRKKILHKRKSINICCNCTEGLRI